MTRPLLTLIALTSACVEYKIGFSVNTASDEPGAPEDTAAAPDSAPPVDSAVDSQPTDPVDEVDSGTPCEESDPGLFLVVGVEAGEGLLATHAYVDGAFGAGQIVAPDATERADSFVVGDVNGDGVLDIAARGETSDHLSLLVWDACVSSWTVSDLGLLPVHLEGGGDLDNDGDLDLVGVADDYRSAQVWLGDGAGHFVEAPDALSLDEVYSGYGVKVGVHAADLSGDDVPDLVLADYDSMAEDTSRLWLATGRGDGTFDAPVRIGTVSTAVNALDLIDLDGDGHPDLLAGLDDDGDAGMLYLGVGKDGGLGSLAELVDLNPSGEYGTNNPGAGRIAAYDWDGDGYPDPIVSYQEDPYAPIYNSLHLLEGLSDLTLDRVSLLETVGSVPMMNFGVPLASP